MTTIGFCEEALKDHMLTTVVEGGLAQVYRMHAPGTRHLCVQLTFGPEGISIMGDPRLGPHGQGLNYAYPGRGRSWFLGATSPSYLCDKFLREVWQADVAAEQLAEEIAEADDLGHSPAMVEHLRNVLEELKGNEFATEQDFADLLHEAPDGEYYDTADGMPGYALPRRDSRWLVAIQRRFRALYLEREKR